MGRRNFDTAKEKVWKTAKSIRLSREDGNDESYSIQGQRETIDYYIEHSEENFVVVDEYVDDGKSGSDVDRENFQRMINDIEKGRINCIIVCDLSRLSRNFAQSGQLLEEYFVMKNVRFISLNLPKLDSYKNPEEISSLGTHMQSVMNDHFVYETSLKIRNKLEVKKKIGLFVGAFAPYGLRKDPDNKHHLLIDEEVAPICRDMLDWAYEGKSKRWIAMKLNELGIPSPSVYKKQKGSLYFNPHVTNSNSLWTDRVVREILTNEMLIGNMVQGKGKIKSHKVHIYEGNPKDEWIIVPNRHKALFDKDKFYRVQELFKNDTKAMPGKPVEYLFSGLLKCADCGRAMHRSKTKDKVYYKCKTYKDLSKTACSIHSIREDELEKAVLEAINSQLILIEDISKMIEQIENSPITKNELTRIKEALQKQNLEITKLNGKKDGLYNDWKDGIITKNDMFRLRENYEKQIETIEKNIKSLEHELDLMDNGLSKENPIFSYYKAFNQLERLDRDIVLKLVDRIYIHEEKRIHIDFRFKDQQKHLLSLIEANKKTLEDEPSKVKKLKR